MKGKCALTIVAILVISLAGVMSDSKGGDLSVTYNEQNNEKDENTATANEGPITTDDGSNIEDFVPTKQWQKVKPGQAIPAGLHVRLNMETGEREAKLMDVDEEAKRTSDGKLSGSEDTGSDQPKLVNEEDRLVRMKEALEQAAKELEGEEENVKYWKEGGKEGMVNLGKDHFTRDELKEALKKYKASKDDVQDEKLKEESIKKKFRPIEELKKDLEEMELDIKTDIEILTELVDKYKSKDLSIDDRMAVLEDFEYYVHQIDNAINFADMGGLELILLDLNHTDIKVRSAAAFVIGSAVQSNPKVQIKSIETGAMAQLIRMLPAETTETVRSRVIYALSSLLRHFPFAQKKFIELGGMQALRDLSSEAGNDKLKIKIVTLLGDLVSEQTSLLNTPFLSTDEVRMQKLNQYQMVPIFDSIKEHGWCDFIPTLLALQDNDHREKTLIAMKEMLPACKENFKDISPTLNSLETEFKKLAQKDFKDSGDEDSHFNDLAVIVRDIINEFDRAKDEL